ncbi:hypothetical protein JTB14_025536 [Gonioctena quinquepunctata]|nr:hypothetical protein JTB14_025536 [Gonioctena quinquepunctata]
MFFFNAQAYPQEPVNHPFAEVAKEFLVASEKLVDATLDLADTVVNILADDAGTLRETLGMVVVKVENVIWPSIQGIDERCDHYASWRSERPGSSLLVWLHLMSMGGPRLAQYLRVHPLGNLLIYVAQAISSVDHP